MANDTNFFESLKEDIAARIHVAAPARVVRAYGTQYETREADVVPLYKNKGEELPLIPRVPVMRHVGFLETGSTVELLFNDRALDNMSGGSSFDPEFSRRHSLTDAVIIGRFY